jgi:hypothetical protein
MSVEKYLSDCSIWNPRSSVCSADGLQDRGLAASFLGFLGF